MAPSHKRKRVQLSPEEEGAENIEHPLPQEKHDPSKEQEVWESFKDEHVEACSASLLPLLLQYIKKRRELKSNHIHTSGASETESGVEPKEEHSKSPDPSTRHSTEAHDVSQRIPTPSGLPSKLFKPATTTREMLSQIACIADEMLRASEEKVNVAQAAYDSVDRHVRLLQQAIKDQEALITLGARPGHLEPGNLSELTVGRWVKPARATLSPIDGDDLNEGLDGTQEAVAGDDPSEAFGRLQISGAKKGRGRAKASQQKSDEVNVASTPPLTITLPAQIPSEQEEVYCYCKQGSFGERRYPQKA
ncbi:hypothetical protein C0995_010585 [Termitomyces sp. Mi166|nr:hypothetical protein C0995_010585 [Termitomyces sp. Mi166\